MSSAARRKNVQPASVGVRELKNHASKILKRVQAGETILVTDRNKAVATIAPVSMAKTEEERIRDAVAAGLLRWDGSRPRGAARPARSRGSRASDIVIEDRR